MDVQYVQKYCMGTAMRTIYTERDKQNKLLVCKRVNDQDSEYVVTEWRHPTYRVVVARSTSGNGHTVAWRELQNYDGTTRIFPW
jgi:hypothetical protein